MPSVAHIIRRRRNRKHRQRDDQTRTRFWSLLIGSSLGLAVLIPLGIILGLAGVVYGRAVSAMPSPADTIYLDPIVGPTNIYDRTGEILLYSVSDPLGNDREWLELETLPPYVVEATLHMEDPDFYESAGFDFGQVLLEMWRYIIGLETTPENSLAARLAQTALIEAAQDTSNMDSEALRIALTAEVQRLQTPQEILTWYLNTAYYGSDAYGIEAAAQVYFDKSAADLSLDEAAMLAAIPPAPQFNPFDDLQAAQGRQLDLLRTLLTQDVITREQFSEASSRVSPVRSDLAQAPRLAPYFSLFARDQAEDILNAQGMDGGLLVSRGGLRIISTLDSGLHEQTDCVLRTHITRLQGRPDSPTTVTGQPCVAADYLEPLINPDISQPPQTGTLMLQDVNSGEILSMVGEATDEAYQPGLTLQPFAYFTGLRYGYTPATMLLDIPTPFPGSAEGLIYTPTNPDNEYRGPLNLRDAMAAYLRTPAATVADSRGMSRVLSDAHRIGLNSLQQTSRYDLSLLERGGQVSLLDMVYAYSVFAAHGEHRGVSVETLGVDYRDRDPVAILRIEDHTGNVLWEYDTSQPELNRTRIMNEELAFLVTDMLADDQTRRSVLNIDGRTLDIQRPAALISGLTQDNADNWTIGYTPQLIGGVHLGRPDRQALSLQTHGLQGAAPVWQAMMRYAHDRYSFPAAQWPQPEGITRYIICEQSGLVPPPDSACPTRSELFLTDVYPTREDTYWRNIEVNSQTNTLATTYTPPNLVQEQVYFIPPDSALEWWTSNNLPLPPETYDLSVPDELSAVEITSPQSWTQVGGEVEIFGAMDTNGMQSFQLSYGADAFNPSQWFEIGGTQTDYTPGQPLAIWDTTALEGTFTLQLSVTYANSRRDADYAVGVTVDNQPPTVDLQTGNGEDGTDQVLYRWPAEDTISLRAIADDNLGIERVEFYHNGVLLGTAAEWPYGFEYDIERQGIEVFRVVAYDRVGNSAADEVQVDVIRASGGVDR